MKLLKEEFNDIINKQRIKPVFQPIVSLKNGENIGYEALSRIVNPQQIRNSEELFNLAGIYGKIWELEQLCRRKILEKYGQLYSRDNVQTLFLNINPMVIHDKEFFTGFTRQYLEKYKLNPDNIVFELTERSAVEDMRGFKDVIRHYKAQGYKLAIDDAGSCYSGLNLICDIVPHYLKLDIALIHNIHKDTIKYAMVKSMVEFANLTNIQLIAEGIECEEELKTLLKLGVHNGQGFFLRTPDENFRKIEKNALDIIRKFNSQRNICKYGEDRSITESRLVLFKIENYKSFRAYCLKYGDEKGDRIIRMMKTIIADQLSKTEVMAMLDEETVVCVIEKENYKIKCETIINVFRRQMKEFYEKTDWERGYMTGRNKHGANKKYPLVSICSERVV